MTLGSARLSFGSELSNSRICNSPFAPKMGKDVLPGFCSGRSATRKSSQVWLLNRKTPGFSRHSTFIPSMLGRMSAGLRMGFSAKRFAMSGMDHLSCIRIVHEVPGLHRVLLINTLLQPLVFTQVPSPHDEGVGRGQGRGESLEKRASSPRPSPPSFVR